MKIGFFTDSHFRDDTPKLRTDDIWETQLNKLNEIKEIAEEQQLDFIIHGGDFFNTKRPSHKLVRMIVEWTNQLPCPMLGILGNHDILGYNLESVERSGLGVLLEAGALKKLDLIEDVNEKLVIKAVHVNAHVEEHYGDDYLFDEKYDGWTKLIISHNYIIPTTTMPFGFVHPDTIKTNADLVLCGHYHVPFEYRGTKTVWKNPGPLCRWTINECKHNPNMIVVTIDENKIKTEDIFLTSAIHADQVFDLTSVEEEKERQLNIDAFVNSLEQTSFSNVDIEQLVRETGKKQSIPVESINLILDKIKKAREVLK